MAAMGRCVSMAAMALCGRYDRYDSMAAMGRCVSMAAMALWPLWGAVCLYGRYGALCISMAAMALCGRYGALCLPDSLWPL